MGGRQTQTGTEVHSVQTFSWEPWGSSVSARSLAPLNRSCCNLTQPRAGVPAGNVMKGLFLPSGRVLN